MLVQVATPMALVIGALALPIPDGVEAQPVLGADPPEVAVHPLDGPQENEEGGLLQAAGQVGPPHRCVLDQQPQLFDRFYHPVTPSRIWL